MAIKNTNLGGTDWIASAQVKAVDLNDTLNAVYNLKQFSKQGGMNMIRQAIDRATIYSVNGTDGVVEAYIDADGRNGTVITASTDATFDTDKYKATGTADSTIIQSIPAGVMSSTITAVGVATIYGDKEDDDDIQLRLYNSTTSTGWYSPDKPGSIAAFTTPPTRVAIQLLPQSTSPVSGSPSIKGIYFITLK